jgi:8-oxo-dGTP pyrophosphatase MutT (NUDIX family)
MKNYVKELRALVGQRPLILPASIVLLLDSKGNILLQRRADDGKWGIPGGAMEPGESYEETAEREVLEETGLTIRSMKLYHVFSGKEYFNQYPNGDQAYNALATFVCTDYDGRLQSDSESLELQFFPLDQLPVMSWISGKVLAHYKQNQR